MQNSDGRKASSLYGKHRQIISDSDLHAFDNMATINSLSLNWSKIER